MRLWQVKSNIRNICLNIRYTNKFNKTSLSFISYISFISIILKISLKNIFIDYIYVFRLQLKISLYYTWFIKQVKIKQRRIARNDIYVSSIPLSKFKKRNHWFHIVIIDTVTLEMIAWDCDSNESRKKIAIVAALTDVLLIRGCSGV